jgi:hypothetical protein
VPLRHVLALWTGASWCTATFKIYEGEFGLKVCQKDAPAFRRKRFLRELGAVTQGVVRQGHGAASEELK